MRAYPAIALALVLACGCSSETEGSTAGGEGGGEPFTGPRGAVNMEVYASEAQACPPGNLHVDIGNPRTSPPEEVEDGRGGATVACNVHPSGPSFAASGSISNGTLTFSFADVVLDDELKSAIGSVAFIDPEGVSYASEATKPCVFQIAPQSDQGIDLGRIFVQFDCTSLVSGGGDPAQGCSSRYGYVLLQGCEKTAP